MKYTNILHFMNDFRLFYPLPISCLSHVVLYRIHISLAAQALLEMLKMTDKCAFLCSLLAYLHPIGWLTYSNNLEALFPLSV